LRITSIRIARFLFLHDRHRHFREIVEHEVIDWPTFNLADGCVEKVSPKALSGCDAYFLFHEVRNVATKRHKKYKGMSSVLSCTHPLLYFSRLFVANYYIRGLGLGVGVG